MHPAAPIRPFLPKCSLKNITASIVVNIGSRLVQSETDAADVRCNAMSIQTGAKTPPHAMAPASLAPFFAVSFHSGTGLALRNVGNTPIAAPRYKRPRTERRRARE